MSTPLPLPVFTTGADFAFSVELVGTVDADFDDIAVEYALATECGRTIVSLSSQVDDDRLVFADISQDDTADQWAITVRLPAGFLEPGTYHHEARFRRLSTNETSPIFAGDPSVTRGPF